MTCKNGVGRDIRRRLSFGGQSLLNLNQSQIDSDIEYYNSAELSSGGIIKKQKEKLKQKKQEINDLQYELNCAYKLLNAVHKNRINLNNHIMTINTEYQQQTKKIYKQLDEYRHQAMLFQKEQRELEDDYLDHNELMIEVSPAKSRKKSKSQYNQIK